MELAQDRGQIWAIVFNLRVVSSLPEHPKELQKHTAAPEVRTLPNVAEVFSSHEQKGPY
jgi:hypothetical protein